KSSTTTNPPVRTAEVTVDRIVEKPLPRITSISNIKPKPNDEGVVFSVLATRRAQVTFDVAFAEETSDPVKLRVFALDASKKKFTAESEIAGKKTSETVTLQELPEGTYTLHAEFVNTYGTTGESFTLPGRITVVKPNEPPILSITDPDPDPIDSAQSRTYFALDARNRESTFPFTVSVQDPDKRAGEKVPTVLFTIKDSSGATLVRSTVSAPNYNDSKDRDRIGTRKVTSSDTTDTLYTLQESAFTNANREVLRSAGKGGRLSLLKPGTYTLSVGATDARGDTVTKSMTVLVNDVPIVQSITSDPQAPVMVKKKTDSATVAVTVTATDTDGVSEVRIKKDNDGGTLAQRIGTSNEYQATFTLPVGAYIFTAEASDTHVAGHTETGVSRTALTVSVVKENEAPAKPTLSTIPVGKKSFVVPDDLVIIKLENFDDVDGDPLRVEFFIGEKRVATKKISDREYRLDAILNGAQTIIAKVSDDKNHTTVSDPLSVTFVDKIEIEQNAPNGTVKNQPIVTEFTTMTSQEGLIILPEGVRKADVRFKIKASDNDGLRALRIFEQGNELAGKTVQYSPAVKQVSHEIPFEQLDAGVHQFVARAMDVGGTLSLRKEFFVYVAGDAPARTRTDTGSSAKWGSPGISLKENILSSYETARGIVSTRIKKTTPSKGGAPRLSIPQQKKPGADQAKVDVRRTRK
ncbi:MAG: hypothetical protein AAB416_03820, partial [Patescibacteria group bacterium]